MHLPQAVIRDILRESTAKDKTLQMVMDDPECEECGKSLSNVLHIVAVFQNILLTTTEEKE